MIKKVTGLFFVLLFFSISIFVANDVYASENCKAGPVFKEDKENKEKIEGCGKPEKGVDKTKKDEAIKEYKKNTTLLIVFLFSCCIVIIILGLISTRENKD